MSHNKQNVPPSLRFRWKLLKHVCIESSRRLTVCTSTSQSKKTPDSRLSHLIGAVSQRLVRGPSFSLPSSLLRLSGISDPGYIHQCFVHEPGSVGILKILSRNSMPRYDYGQFLPSLAMSSSMNVILV